MSSRSTASDAFDALSEPEPFTGTVMLATVPALLTSTVMGPFNSSLANARRLRSAIALWASGDRTSSALTTTLAGIPSPGKDAWSCL